MNIFTVIAGMTKGKNVMVFLDSNHTKDHVLRELKLYSSLVSKGSYIVVDDTGVDYLPKKMQGKYRDDNPMMAVREFMKDNKMFFVDETIDTKLLVCSAPKGYLKRT